MNDLLHTLYEAYHKIVPVAAPGAPAGPADIVGPFVKRVTILGLTVTSEMAGGTTSRSVSRCLWGGDGVPLQQPIRQPKC